MHGAASFAFGSAVLLCTCKNGDVRRYRPCQLSATNLALSVRVLSPCIARKECLSAEWAALEPLCEFALLRCRNARINISVTEAELAQTSSGASPTSLLSRRISEWKDLKTVL